MILAPLGRPMEILENRANVIAPEGISLIELRERRIRTDGRAQLMTTKEDSRSSTPSTANSIPAALPPVVDRDTFQKELDTLRVREKAHTHEGDAIAAARRRLPMVAVDSSTPLIGERGKVTLLDAFEGRQMLLAYYFMWHAGRPAPEQCEGCTWATARTSVSCPICILATSPSPSLPKVRTKKAPTTATSWAGEMPWYSASDSLNTLLFGRRVGRMHIVCYLRQGSNVFETYWTTSRGVEVMDNSYHLLDLTVYGRQEKWENSPTGWPQQKNGEDVMRINGRPIAQWSRVEAGRSDDLGNNHNKP